MKKSATKKGSTSYQAVEKNIYKVGKSFRVRVNGRSEYCPNITQARKMRTKLKHITTVTSEPIF